MPVLPAMPTSTVPSIAEMAGNVMSAIAIPTEFVIGLFLGILVIQILFQYLGNRTLGPVDNYEDIGDVDDGGAFGGPSLSDTVDWDELDRRASGSLEHDAMV